MTHSIIALIEHFFDRGMGDRQIQISIRIDLDHTINYAREHAKYEEKENWKNRQENNWILNFLLFKDDCLDYTKKEWSGGEFS